MLNTFFDDLIETPNLKRFFCDAPVETIKVHQAKLFRCLLGPEVSQPKSEDVAEYMIQTHTRLFREAGLDATHYDLVVQCLIRSLESCLVDQQLITEVLSILVPLRVVFDYGANVAKREKEMDEEQMKTLPVCSAKTIGTDALVVLPVAPNGEIPWWLAGELKKASKTKTLRYWTAYLSDRCSWVADKFLADYMMDIPYLELEPYMNALIQLALLPDDIDDKDAFETDILLILKFPRGQKKDPLPLVLFECLVIQFGITCEMMDVKSDVTSVLVNQLLKHRSLFPNVDATKIYGITSPHPLDLSRISFEIGTVNAKIKVKKNKKKLDRVRMSKNDGGTSEAPSPSSSTTTSTCITSLRKTRQKIRIFLNFSR